MLGFLSRKSRLHFFEAQETMTAQFVIESIEALLPHLSGPTVLVLDNASVHRSKLVQVKRRVWKQKGLRLLFLPPYCPHLNLIETLWRQTKYRWLDCEAYRNFETLCQDFETLCRSVTDILTQIGTKYRLSFALLLSTSPISQAFRSGDLRYSPYIASDLLSVCKRG